ncbi:transcription factor bHLH68-like isoform X1 [Oryza brachyantha]|uniref:transcription factor bHLH68-like isoform X1 n=1 Tax=Oryza brachyantha TaxID=4533 RepID=UPI001AD98A31|nr:transcription factor bHLH68-like isoform X1 [Oryza brachyantha]
MNRGEFQSSLVQQMIWSGSGTGTATAAGGLMGSLKPCHEPDQEASPNMPSLSSPSLIFSQQFQHGSSGLVPMNGAGTASLPSLHDGGGQENLPESWSQLLLGGLAGDQERYSATAALLSKGLENWGDHAPAASAACMAAAGAMKEEASMAQAATTAAAAAAYSFYGSHLAGDQHDQIQAAAGGASKSQLSQMLLASSPRSCITTSNMLDFSNTAAPPELRSHHHNSDNSSECNSTATGSALKKARVQASSSAQSTLKVRKERLGDRITALHQIVSPFGKTDTASVLQETIGYIRFLLSQIEALSYPYMGDANGTGPTQNGPGGERNPGLFPEYPGQLLNHNGNTGAQQPAAQPEQQGVNEEGKRDLRSRGLCLVPVSCTSHFGGDNAADYWAPAPLGGILR